MCYFDDFRGWTDIMDLCDSIILARKKSGHNIEGDQIFAWQPPLLGFRGRTINPKMLSDLDLPLNILTTEVVEVI